MRHNEIWIEQSVTPMGDPLFTVKAILDYTDTEVIVGGCGSEDSARSVIFGFEQGLKAARQAIPYVRYDVLVRQAA